MEGFRTNRIEILFGFSLELGTLSNKLQKKWQKKNEGNHIPGDSFFIPGRTNSGIVSAFFNKLIKFYGIKNFHELSRSTTFKKFNCLFKKINDFSPEYAI